MDKPCLGKIKERYTIVCSECNTAGLCALLVVSKWLVLLQLEAKEE